MALQESMIHVLTVHHTTLEWIPIQHNYLQAHLKNYKVWSFIDKVDFSPWPFDFKLHSAKKSGMQPHGSGGHAWKLDRLVQNLESHPDSDIIIFLDSDAFPISPLNKFIKTALQHSEFISIVREEMGLKFPHPSFACCKLGFWRKHDLTWRPKIDTGGCLQEALENKKIKWHKLKRTSSLSSHPVLFGVYGDIIYHHGRGSGMGFHLKTRVDKNLPPEERSSKRDFLDLFESVKDINFFNKTVGHK